MLWPAGLVLLVDADARLMVRLRCDTLPNESRLSCGAKLKYSQLEFYHTAGRTFAGLVEEGRRQLQALVRLRTIDHSLGPSPAGARRGTHRHWPYAGIVMPNGRTLRTPQRRRGPRATGPSLGKALRIEP